MEARAEGILHIFTQQMGETEMKVRRMVRQVLGVAVVVWLFAPLAFGQTTDIIHRYSFTNDASDSVGTANGTLMGNATVSGGQLVLDGSDGTYLDLAAIGPDIANLTSTTVEAWVTWNDPTAYWERIFDFGQDTTTYMFLTPKAERSKVRFAISMNGGGAEQFVNHVGQLTDTTLDPTEQHVAVTIDATAGIITLYVNGSPSCILFNTTLQPYVLGTTPNNYLGKSQFADPYFNGSIDEFRIYGRALSAAEIAASFAAGPNGTPP
jgi:hypothetical protein